MNTKKYKNYALGALVLFIWGFIILKIVSHFKTDSYEQVIGSQTSIAAGFKVTKENFIIDGKYPDPFLKNIKHKIVKQQSDFSGDVFLQKNMAESSFWPAITYWGVVETSDKKRRLGIISIDNQHYLVNEQDSVMLVKVLKLYADSIRVRFDNQERSITSYNEE
jgi:hypothetical protein